MTQKSIRAIGVIGLVFLAFLVFFGIGWWQRAEAFPVKPAMGIMPLEVSASEVYESWQQGAYILDVRALHELQEWGAGRIPGATLIPLEQIKHRIAEIPVDVPIYVVCGLGQRSASGRDILLEAGYESVTSMSGGMQQWMENRYEVIQRP
jgi:hydroxyacylglutathione hydrolase